MKTANPDLKRVAEYLIAQETAARPSGETTSPVLRVCEKLRPSLATLLGSIGFGALLGRALALAGAEVPWLRGVHLKADGSCPELGTIEAPAREISRGGTILIAHLIGLLITFIGEDLTMRLMRDTWPDLPSDILARAKGNEDEKSK